MIVYLRQGEWYGGDSEARYSPSPDCKGKDK